MNNQKAFNLAAVAALVFVVLLGGLMLFKQAAPVEKATSLSVSSPCSFAPGGVRFNAGSGCEISMTTGSAITADSGVNITADTITATNLISQALTFAGTTANVSGLGTFGTLTSKGATNVTGATTITGALTVGGAVNSVGALSINSVSFSGPIKYGYVASQASGAAITHGFATTPTMCVATPVLNAGSHVSATIGTINTTTFTVTMASTGPLYWMCGQ